MAGDAWDYQWLFRRLRDGGLTVVPSRNLISNIGFGEDSTHTADPANLMAHLPVASLPCLGEYPHPLAADKSFDRLWLDHFAPSLGYRVIRKLKGVFRG